MIYGFRWVEDVEYDGPAWGCPQCGSTCEAVCVEPDRSHTSYLTAGFLCTGDSGRPGPKGGTCRMFWPRAGSRRLERSA